MLAGQIDGDNILTLEGLAKDGELDKLQASFIESGAVQCGFCTPGMILTAKALLNKNPHPSYEEIKRAMSGNLCRCTGYAKIFKAVTMAAEQ
jgi:carbon-monoxide dehydrogenase small subunit